jgi:hypothetical protein
MPMRSRQAQLDGGKDDCAPACKGTAYSLLQASQTGQRTAQASARRTLALVADLLVIEHSWVMYGSPQNLV